MDYFQLDYEVTDIIQTNIEVVSFIKIKINQYPSSKNKNQSVNNLFVNF